MGGYPQAALSGSHLESPRLCRGIVSDPDVLNSAQVADYLGLSRRALSTLVRRRIIDPGQVTDFAPWAVHRSHLDSRPVQQAVAAIKNSKKGTQGGDGAENQGLLFSMISAKEEKEAL